MRLCLILLGTLAGLWFTFTPDPSAAATATPRPTPTIKACHICNEDIIPPASPTAAEFAKKSEAVVQAVMFWMATCPHCGSIQTRQTYGTVMVLTGSPSHPPGCSSCAPRRK